MIPLGRLLRRIRARIHDLADLAVLEFEPLPNRLAGYELLPNGGERETKRALARLPGRHVRVELGRQLVKSRFDLRWIHHAILHPRLHVCRRRFDRDRATPGECLPVHESQDLPSHITGLACAVLAADTQDAEERDREEEDAEDHGDDDQPPERSGASEPGERGVIRGDLWNDERRCRGGCHQGEPVHPDDDGVMLFLVARKLQRILHAHPCRVRFSDRSSPVGARHELGKGVDEFPIPGNIGLSGVRPQEPSHLIFRVRHGQSRMLDEFCRGERPFSGTDEPQRATVELLLGRLRPVGPKDEREDLLVERGPAVLLECGLPAAAIVGAA